MGPTDDGSNRLLDDNNNGIHIIQVIIIVIIIIIVIMIAINVAVAIVGCFCDIG